MLRRVVVGKLKQILGDFPGWHIALRVDLPGKEESWPLMGILIFRGRVIDHLKREYLPAEFRQITYEVSNDQMPADETHGQDISR